MTSNDVKELAKSVKAELFVRETEYQKEKNCFIQEMEFIDANECKEKEITQMSKTGNEQHLSHEALFKDKNIEWVTPQVA
jgi:hypothetical protein